MARVVKNQEPHHALSIKDDHGLDVTLIAGGKRRTYLWVGCDHNRLVATVSGEKTLRALARAILREVGEL